MRKKLKEERNEKRKKISYRKTNNFQSKLKHIRKN